MPEYNFGWDGEAQEFILWKRGRKTPVARIPLADGQSLADTVAHVNLVLAGQLYLAPWPEIEVKS